MRTELSSLDLYYLTKEFSSLVGSKIEKVYDDTKVFALKLFGRSEKRVIKIILPSFIFLSEEKGEFLESGKFSLSLRKHISNTKIVGVSQREFERIIEFDLEGKENNYRLYIELFRPGNIILCDTEEKIIMAKQYKGFGARMIRPGITYEYPKKEFNILNLKEGDLVNLLEKSDKSSIVISLATALGLGGLYAEELCEIAKIDKKKQKLNEPEIKKLFDATKELINKDVKGYVYLKNNVIEDITPYELSKYKDLTPEIADSFNVALDTHLSLAVKQENDKKKLSKFENEKEKLHAILKNQEIQIKGMELSSKDNQRKGEVIYERYAQLSKIIEDINKAKEKYSWKEIKEKLKGHKLIKDVNEKDKKITIELED